MIQRILTVLDASSTSDSALRIATSVAGLAGAELLGLYVEHEGRYRKTSLALAIAGSVTGEGIVDVPLSSEEMARVETEIAEEAAQFEKTFRERCVLSEVKGDFRRILGEPVEVISQQARGVDLLILGRYSRSGTGAEDDDESVQSLVGRTSCPIMVVPRDPEGQSSMLVAYDGHMAAERVLRTSLELALVMQISKIHVLTVADDAKEGRKIQEPAFEYLRAGGMEVTLVQRSGNPEDEIVSYANEIEASILALGAYGSNALARAFFGSTTKAVLDRVHAAVLLSS